MIQRVKKFLLNENRALIFQRWGMLNLIWSFFISFFSFFYFWLFYFFLIRLLMRGITAQRCLPLVLVCVFGIISILDKVIKNWHDSLKGLLPLVLRFVKSAWSRFHFSSTLSPRIDLCLVLSRFYFLFSFCVIRFIVCLLVFFPSVFFVTACFMSVFSVPILPRKIILIDWKT